MKDFHFVSEHILRLELDFQVYGLLSLSVSVWLVRSEDRWVLVDCGPPATTDQLISAVAAVTGQGGPHLVILTHAHYDHAGGLSALRMAWNPPIFCHREEAPFVTGELEYRHLKAKHAAFAIARYFLPRAPMGLPVARMLEGGQAVAGMALIHLPGHTPGQIGLLHPEDRALICGDVLMNRGDHLSAPLSVTTADPASARASIERLSELDFEHLLPSHGPPVFETGREAVLNYLGIGSDEAALEDW